MRLCDTIAQKVNPIKLLGESCGLVLLYGGTELLAKARGGNLDEGPVLCTAWYIFGKTIYVVSELACVKYGICSPINSQVCIQSASRTFLQTINKVMKYSLIGVLPGWGICKTFFYPSLQIGTIAIYFAGSLAPYAILATVIGIIQDIQRRYLETRPVVDSKLNETHMSDATDYELEEKAINLKTCLVGDSKLTEAHMRDAAVYELQAKAIDMETQQLFFEKA